jgi:hypothetical protein
MELSEKLSRYTRRETYAPFVASLRYAFYVISHPLDGFWDLTHEKRGSLAAANCIVLVTLISIIWKIHFTSFLFMRVNWDKVNIYMEIAGFLFPLAIFCVCNWGVTTLFDGKGKLSQIYMGTAYALAPFPLIQIPLIVLSQFITVREGAFYWFLSDFSIAWVIFLVIAAMMMIHSFGLGKTLLFLIASLFAMLVFIFIFLLFFSMISDGVAYFVSLSREILFRLN